MKTYEPGKVHYEGAVVSHARSTWQALRDTGHAPPHEDWIALAAHGEDGRSPHVCGSFSTEAKYRQLDVVVCEGAAFMARSDEPGRCPGPGWQMIARQGKPGIKGSKGDRGDRGPKGEAGDPGAVIVGWKIDREAYTITPILSDASDLPAINMRELFEQFHDEAPR